MITIPKRILHRSGLTPRQWKSKKRQELKKVTAAFDEFRFGCAYTPNYPTDINRIEIALANLKNALSQKNWGR